MRTLDPDRPLTEAVALRGERIAAVGSAAELLASRGPRTEVLEAPAVLPGFVDAHLHFVALARRAADVDVSAERAPAIRHLLGRIRDAAASLPAGAWIRAFGWDETLVAERRAPTRAELDAAAPGRAVRLLHRTGHAAVLSSEALRRAGLDDGPGESGLVIEPGSRLRGRLPPPDERELSALAAAASIRLLEAGVTAFHDPTAGAGAAEVSRLRRLSTVGALRQRVRVYGSEDAFSAAVGPGGDVRVAGVKIVVEEATEPEALAVLVAEADARGRTVALHAVEGGPLVAAAAALGRLGAERVRRRGHRIEHASLCPPPLADELAACGATIVAQPGFLPRFADKYRREVDEPDWLCPLRAYLDRGIAVALGSDAPIADARPLAAVAAAAGRDALEGLGGGQAVSVAEAVRAHTRSAAAAGGDGADLGVLAPGRLADAVLLERDPFDAEPAEVAEIGVRATIAAGAVAWSRP